jgi:hypothetical protein
VHRIGGGYEIKKPGYFTGQKKLQQIDFHSFLSDYAAAKGGLG